MGPPCMVVADVARRQLKRKAMNGFAHGLPCSSSWSISTVFIAQALIYRTWVWRQDVNRSPAYMSIHIQGFLFRGLRSLLFMSLSGTCLKLKLYLSPSLSYVELFCFQLPPYTVVIHMRVCLDCCRHMRQFIPAVIPRKQLLNDNNACRPKFNKEPPLC